jgi:hypothetical protein
MLLPMPRASSGSFLAPKSNRITTKIMIISGIPMGPMVVVLVGERLATEAGARNRITAKVSVFL